MATNLLQQLRLFRHSASNFAQQSTSQDQDEACLIPGTTAEYFDCCSQKSQAVCFVLGQVDLAYSLFLLVLLVVVLCKSEWLRHQWLMIYIFLFCIATFICKLAIKCVVRGIYYLFFGDQDATMKQNLAMRSAPVLTMFIAVVALMLYHLFLDITMIFLYGICMMALIYYCSKVYKAIRRNLLVSSKSKSSTTPAKVAQPYILLLILVSSLALFCRISFLSIADIDKLKVSQHQYEVRQSLWPTLLSFIAASEVVLSVCLLLCIYFDRQVELITEAYYIQTKHYLKVSQEDLVGEAKEQGLKLQAINSEIEQFKVDHQTYREYLRLVDYSYLEELTKVKIVPFNTQPPQTSFEDSLQESISRLKQIEGQQQNLCNEHEELERWLEKADFESVPLVDYLKRRLGALDKAAADCDNRLQEERLEFVHTENKWREYQQILDKDNGLIFDRVKRNRLLLKNRVEQVEKVLQDLSQFYASAASNPYLNESYFSQLKLQLTKDLGLVADFKKKFLEVELEGKYPDELRKMNYQVFEAIQGVAMIEKQELSLLRDANILFQFEKKMAEMKEKLQTVQMEEQQEREKARQNKQLFDQIASDLVEIRGSASNHELSDVQADYSSILQRRQSLDFSSLRLHLDLYQKLMYRTSRCEKNINDLHLRVKKIKERVSASQLARDEVQLLNKEVERLETVQLRQARKFETVVAVMKKDYEGQQVVAQEVEQMQQLELQHKRAIEVVEQGLANIRFKCQNYKQLSKSEVEDMRHQVQSYMRLLEDSDQKLSESASIHQKEIRQRIVERRQEVKLKAVQQEIQKMNKDAEGFAELQGYYQRLISEGEGILVSDIPLKAIGDEFQLQGYRELLNMQIRLEQVISLYHDLLQMVEIQKHSSDYIKEFNEKYLRTKVALNSRIKLLKGLSQAFFRSWKNFNREDVLQGALSQYEERIQSIEKLAAYSAQKRQLLIQFEMEVWDSFAKVEEVVGAFVRFAVGERNQEMRPLQINQQLFVSEELLEELKGYRFQNRETNNIKEEKLHQYQKLAIEINSGKELHEKQMRLFREKEGQVLAHLSDPDQLFDAVKDFQEVEVRLKEACEELEGACYAVSQVKVELLKLEAKMRNVEIVQGIMQEFEERRADIFKNFKDHKQLFLEKTLEKVNQLKQELLLHPISDDDEQDPSHAALIDLQQRISAFEQLAFHIDTEYELADDGSQEVMEHLQALAVRSERIEDEEIRAANQMQNEQVVGLHKRSKEMLEEIQERCEE